MVKYIFILINYNLYSLSIMRNTQKNIKDADIELFLYYNPEVALQIVHDLIDEPGR